MGRKIQWGGIAALFALAFILNIVWEEAHSVLYLYYKGAEITHVVLLRAALFDAGFIAVLGVPFFSIPQFSARQYLFLIAGFIFAVCLEWWALGSGRWAYNALMPIIPILGVGLTPAIQLGITGYAAMRTVSGWTMRQ